MCSLGVAGFFRVCLDRSCAHVGRWVRFHWFGTSECVLVVAGMFGFVCFVPVRPRDRWARSVWPGSSVNAMMVATFSDSSGCTLGFAGFVWVHLFRLGAPWESFGSFRFICFVWEHPRGPCYRSGSPGLFG